MRKPAVVTRVIPADLNEDHVISAYDEALVKFEAGQWDEATGILKSVGDEPCSQFLLKHIQQQTDSKPPMGFNGVIELSSK